MSAVYGQLDPETALLLRVCLLREQPEELEEACSLGYEILVRAAGGLLILDWAIQLISDAMDGHRANLLEHTIYWLEHR